MMYQAINLATSQTHFTVNLIATYMVGLALLRPAAIMNSEPTILQSVFDTVL